MLTSKIVEFSRLLRQAGVRTTPRETVDAAAGVKQATPSSLDQLQYVLRSALVKSPEHYPIFETIFRQFWRERTLSVTLTREQTEEPERGVSKIAPKLNFRSLAMAREEMIQAAKLVAMYSPFQNLATKKFGKLDESRGLVVKRNVRRLARMLATRPGRRYRPALRGELDLRRMIRSGLGTQGQLIRILRRRRKLGRAPIVLFCDVSGSMEGRSEELLLLMDSIQNSVSKAETFVFSTDLVQVSEWLRGKSLREAANIVSRRIRVWGSGTRIGYCLASALTSYSHFLSRDAIAMIISDGWDVGDLKLLSAAMAELRSRVSRIVWLNPWANQPNFKPAVRGLLEALKFVDLHAGLVVLYDRRELVHNMRRMEAQ